jgi:hypothetical protein
MVMMLLLLGSLFLVNLAVHDLQNIIIPLFRVGNNAVGAVLDAAPHRERAVALQQVERTPAEQTGLPFIEIMARIKTALLVGEKLVVHRCNSSLGI